MSATSIDEDVVFFGFEADFVASLRCIPMVVRFKFDLCGVKLSLKGWSRFDHETRSRCAHLPTRCAGEIDRYRDFLCQAIEQVGLEPALLPVATAPAWDIVDVVPAQVLEKGAELGLTSDHFTGWRDLSALQRFALLKLTRRGHENENFRPAMREFGMC
jgi:hypothetical protein